MQAKRYVFIGQANWKNRVRGLTTYFTEALKVIIGIGVVVGLIISLSLYFDNWYSKHYCPRIVSKQLRQETNCN